MILSLAACGSEHAGGGTSVRPSGAPATSLTVQVRASKDAAPKTWALTCDPVGGDLPAADRACAALKAAPADVFTAPGPDRMCTEIYGGPQTATVKGTFDRRSVTWTFKRTNGCEISRWEKLAPLFGDGAKRP
ncbi:SSI family serine proteinase inhibitor [Actinomadura atramentaria]|uniref:SSI family serine proteinase inhibitor n=1 Tax=Actinomadura atramentaria TaxID=1990 RepID=UPI001F0A494E|nr:SSI family serine proteinase inhibitor [Actinomadura atramentaria]